MSPKFMSNSDEEDHDTHHHTYWKVSNVTHPYAINPNNKTTRQCSILFYVYKDISPPIHLYYRLTNFYQNEREDAKVSQSQIPSSSIHAGWSRIPFLMIDTSQSTVATYNITNITYNFTSTGIAAPGDSSKYGKTHYSLSEIRPPPNWEHRYPNGTYTEAFPPINPAEDEHFQVWMRIAGLPNFRKIYGKNDSGVLTAGYYQIDIDT
ncbi:12850_t:CDS:2, partial [Acaulospora colombiana]